MNITLRQIKAFLAIAEHGTFSRASLAMHISQPALTRLIQELESSIDLRLLERAQNGTSLTQSGEEFRSVASHFVRELEQSLINLKEHSDGVRGTVTIAVGIAFATTVMPSVIRYCRENHPGIKIVLRDDNTEGITKRVIAGGVDFGIGYPAGDLSKLALQPLLSAPLGIISSPKYFTIPDTIHLADLSKYPIIFHESDNIIWKILNENMGTTSISSKAVTVGTSLSTVLCLVAEGLGISVMSALGASAPICENLTFTPFSDGAMERKVYLISRNSAPLSKAAYVVQDLINKPVFRSKLRNLIFWN